MKKSNETKHYSAGYNPDRSMYISTETELDKDGKKVCDHTYICFDTTDIDTKKPSTIRIEVGKPYYGSDGKEHVIDEDITFVLDEMFCEMDLKDRYENELKDAKFEAQRRSYAEDPDNDKATDPWEKLSRPEDDPAYMKEEEKNPDTEKIRKCVEQDLTPEQQDLYFDHFGNEKQLEEIRKEEVEATGKEKSLQSVLNRKNKIIRKVASKAFNTVPVKRHKYPKNEG